MPTTGNIPLQQVVPDEVISSTQWNNEMANIGNLIDAQGAGGYSSTDTQMQVQTNPYPGSVTSHASSIAGEFERIRYILAAITGKSYWYQSPDISISTANNSLVPVGGVIDYPSASVPNSNWHLADGTAISRSAYPTLFALIGTTFGSGDGSTTFNLPNYTDRMAIAAGNLYSLASTGGEATHVLTTTEIPSHNHTATSNVTDPGHQHSTSDGNHFITDGHGAIAYNSGSNLAIASDKTASATTGISVSTSTNNTGGDGAHNNLPPYLAMYKIIRVL